jgi:hypothetical protein
MASKLDSLNYLLVSAFWGCNQGINSGQVELLTGCSIFLNISLPANERNDM